VTVKRYAEGTKVSVHSSQMELKKLVDRYGGNGFFFSEEDHRAVVGCRIRGVFLKFSITRRPPDEFLRTAAGRLRPPCQRRAACAQEYRRQWRALLLFLKGGLEATVGEDPDMPFEKVFLPFTVMPNGDTVDEAVREQVQHAYRTGDISAAPLLPASRQLTE